MPQETKAKASLEVRGAEQPTVAGSTVELGTDGAASFDVLEKAFDFRGDVTLTLKDGRSVGGYLFDRRRGTGLDDSTVRLMPADGTKVSVAYAEIASISFSDRDPAAGKSFETWVKKYTEKKLKGERASIESEVLD